MATIGATLPQRAPPRGARRFEVTLPAHVAEYLETSVPLGQRSGLIASLLEAHAQATRSGPDDVERELATAQASLAALDEDRARVAQRVRVLQSVKAQSNEDEERAQRLRVELADRRARGLNPTSNEAMFRGYASSRGITFEEVVRLYHSLTPAEVAEAEARVAQRKR